MSENNERIVVTQHWGAVERGQWLRFASALLAVGVFGGVSIGLIAWLQWSRDQPMQGTVFGLIAAGFLAFSIAVARSIRSIHSELKR